jgi:hypothetical protein
MRLAVRFDPEVGQSILSYALDLSRANGYPNLSVLISGLQLPKSFATRPCDLSPLARASGLTISSSRLEDLCFWPLQNQSGYIQFLGQRMSAASVDLARPKVCMRCLEEGKQIPAEPPLLSGLPRPWQLAHLRGVLCMRARSFLVPTVAPYMWLWRGSRGTGGAG